MNPKDMTEEALFEACITAVRAWPDARTVDEGDRLLKLYKDTKAEILGRLARRLDEADALRKENKELRKESFALYARLNEYSYQFIYGGRSGVRTAYVLAAPVLASYRLSHPDGFDAKEIEARS